MQELVEKLQLKLKQYKTMAQEAVSDVIENIAAVAEYTLEGIVICQLHEFHQQIHIFIRQM